MAVLATMATATVIGTAVGSAIGSAAGSMIVMMIGTIGSAAGGPVPDRR